MTRDRRQQSPCQLFELKLSQVGVPISEYEIKCHMNNGTTDREVYWLNTSSTILHLGRSCWICRNASSFNSGILYYEASVPV